MVDCATLYVGGRPSTDPCGGWCGPLDVSRWYDVARSQLADLRTLRRDMTRDELERAVGLEDAWERTSIVAPLSSLSTFQLGEATRQAAEIAQGAACLAAEVRTRTSSSVPSSSAPSSDGGWSLPKMPGFPGLPSFPGLPNLNIPWGFVLLAAIALFMFDGGRRER